MVKRQVTERSGLGAVLLASVMMLQACGPIENKVETTASGYGLPKAAPEEVGLSSERLARIQPAMQGFIDEHKAPNMLTIVARHGKVAHVLAQGYADEDTKTPLTPDSIFRIYSMTKPITAAAAMTLYEEGKFALEDPVSKYLPEFADVKVYTENGLVDAVRPITMRMLFTHTAGLAYPGVVQDKGFLKLYPIKSDAERRSAPMTLADHVREVAGLPLIAQPGTEWNYGENITVLSRVVEVISGKTFGAFLKERLFDPLGMNDTAYYVPTDKTNRLTTLYVADEEKGYVKTDAYGEPYTMVPTMEAGGAGLASTGADYLRFAQMLLNGGELDGVRILSPTTVKMMMSNHLPSEMGETPLASLKDVITEKSGLGFGFGGLVVTDPVAMGSAGSVGEYSWGGWANTLFWVDPKQDMVALSFTQVIGGSQYRNGDTFRQMVYQAIVGE